MLRELGLVRGLITRNPDCWEKLVNLVQHMWESRTLPTELSWTILVLLSKVHPDTREIGMFEVLWKVVEAIINTCINTVVTLNNVLYGFLASRGKGTTIMEINMVQELATIDQEPLFLVLLDLQKSYDTLDLGRIL